MARPAVVAVVALLSTVAIAAGDPVADLINQLGDPEPTVRQSAFEQLRAMGSKATPALRQAAHGSRPGIADAAAELLLAGRWWTAADPPNLRKALLGYGQLSVPERAERVKKIIDDRLPDYRAVVIRLLTQDPSDEVGWRALEAVNGDAAWDTSLSAIKVSALTPPLVMQLAKSKDHAGDRPAAVKLARRLLEQEQEHPSSPGNVLSWAVRLVVDAEVQAGHFDAAANFLREQFARGDGTGTSQSDVLDQLLDLHIRHGPLPGFAEDLRRADTEGEPHGTFALALMAGRLGMPIAESALLGSAADRPGESQADRATRLAEIGEWLAPPPPSDAARRPADDAAALLYERVTTSDEPSVRTRVMLAYVMLSQIHAREGRMQMAGDALQRAIDRQDGPLVITRNRVTEVWPIEDEQARVYWYYLLDARLHNDADGIKKRARDLLASGSTDGSLFLDALPSLQDAATPEEVDAYFDRVFETARIRVEQQPANAVYLNDLAWLCARSGRHLDEAVKWAARAVDLVPESANLDTLAEAKFRTGKIRDAIELETRALKDQPEDEPFMQQQLDRFRQAATTRPND